MIINTYFYFIIYFSYFTGFIGIVLGLFYGYNEADQNIIRYTNDFVTYYDIINEYTERIVKKTVFFGIIFFFVGILFCIVFPILTCYLSLIYIYNKFLYLIGY